MTAIAAADVGARANGPIVNDDESYREIYVSITSRIRENEREHEIRTQELRHR
jgi:hypothetical protein